MKVWVVNASPLILLGKIDQLHLLAGAQLHESVVRDALQLAEED